MLKAVRKKLKENYSMLSILYDNIFTFELYNLFLLTVAKTGRGCIPYYSSLSNLGCVVQGLPAGLSFKQPSLYSNHELRSICNHLESIEFIVYS